MLTHLLALFSVCQVQTDQAGSRGILMQKTSNLFARKRQIFMTQQTIHSVLWCKDVQSDTPTLEIHIQ